MNNSTLNIKIQAQSFGNYLRDIWFVALLFVLIRFETTVALPYIWIGLQLIIAIFSLLFFRKTGPNMVIPFVLPSFILLSLFLFGSPIWLFVLSVVFSIWRLQARFNIRQEEQITDNQFTIFYFLTFLGIHFIYYLLGYEGYHFLLYSVFIVGIVLFGGIRLFAVSTNTDKHNALTRTTLIGMYLLSIVVVVCLASVIYYIIPFFRKLFDLLLEAVLRVAIIPFAPVIGYLEDFLKGLQIRQPEEDEHIPIGELPEIETKELATKETFVNFPVGWILTGLAIIVIIFFIRYLLKNKPNKLEIELNNVQYENKQMSDAEEKETKQSNSLYQVETSYLREKYAQFELEAHAYDFVRNKSETVREWFKRMQWQVDTTFFQTYEEIRYGSKMINSEKAELFIKNLEIIKKVNFFKKDV
ncbi:hypothetical protein ACIQYS_18130 [Psychrobacillus sp. NPDC096426]|uniref:hypothetical protein n=1 Tax=Psychrobacillus sp. NPDC096426 TaxID=3364491 RepID=UPI00381E7964